MFENRFYLGYGVLIVGIALRILYLDADPDYYAWVGYIADEGRWVKAAREVALFGRIINFDWLFHLFFAPLFQAANYVVFKLLGVSIWTARLVSALAGSAVLMVFWLALRRVVTPQAMLVGLALLAFEVDLVMLSRVAIPEMPAMLLELLVYVVLVAGRPSWSRLFAAGLLLLATVAMKATTLPMVAIFSVMVLLRSREQQRGDWRWNRLVIFWAGFLAPILLTIPLWISLARRHASVILSNTSGIGRFIGLLNPFTIAAFPFQAEFAPVFNTWALGACFALIGWSAIEKETVEPRLRRYFVASTIWYAMYVPLMLSTSYFPDRYKAHILIPMAVSIVTGISIVHGAAFTGRCAALPKMTRSRRVLTVGLLSLPTAALWAPSLAGVIGYVGIDPARFRIKLACVATALLATAWVARRRGLAGECLRFFFIFPVVGLLGWVLCVRAGLAGNGFWPVAGGELLGWWSVGVPVAALGSAAVARVGRRWDTRRWVALIPAAALCYAVLSVVRILPFYIHPHYSMKQTAEQLGLSLADSPKPIGSLRTEGLFNGNTLPYRAVEVSRWTDRKPEVIVIRFRFDDPEGLVGPEYSLIATYRLFISPEYEDEDSVTLDAIQDEEVVKVYIVKVYRRS